MKNPIPKWSGLVSKGKFIPSDAVSYFSALSRMDGNKVSVMVEPFREARTTAQNRYYWGVVLKIPAEYTGNSDTVIHDAMRARHLCDNPGEPVQIIHSTTDLTTDEFSKYIELIKRDAADGLFGASLYIPDADEVYV